MSTDLYEFTVEWPSQDPQSVIVTGDFDQWSQSLHLFRDTSSNTYSTTIKVPYGCPTRYKFIIDGQWRVVDGKPTEFTQEGHLNNIHYVPLENPNESKPSESTHTEPESDSGEVKVNGSASFSSGLEATSTESTNLPQFITDLVTTIAASEGTSSALQYVASGLGVTIQSVVGVDPINPNQIPLTTPTSPNAPSSAPLSATTTEDSETNSNDMETQTVTSNTTQQSSDEPATDYGFTSSSLVAPLVPITIVPVYAKENCTIDPSKPSYTESENGGFDGVGMPRIKKTPVSKETEVKGDEVVSTHAVVVPPIVITSDDESDSVDATPVVGELGSTLVNPVENEKEAPVLAALQSAPPAVVEQHEEELKKAEALVAEQPEEELKKVETAIVSPSGLGVAEQAETVEAKPEVDQKPEEVNADADKEALPVPPTQIPLPETPATNVDADKELLAPTPAQIPLPETPATNVDAEKEKELVPPTPAQVPLPETPATNDAEKEKELVTPTPAQVPLPETPAKSPAAVPTTNGHQKSPSADTAKTRNTTSSRPSTPTPVTPKKGDVLSSTTSTPFSTASKKKRFSGFGTGSPSKDGNGTIGSRNPKRKSSLFGKIKDIFHHEKKEKGDDERVPTN